MSENDVPQIERLRRYPSVVSQMELLSPGAYLSACSHLDQAAFPLCLWTTDRLVA